MSRFATLVSLVAIGLITSIDTLIADTGPMGLWDRADGRGGVRIAPCGGALCGHVTWLRDRKGPGRIGERVFYAMRQTGAGKWTGMAHNPEDGHDYAGTLTLEGSRMVVQGCAFGGLVCRSLELTRSR